MFGTNCNHIICSKSTGFLQLLSPSAYGTKGCHRILPFCCQHSIILKWNSWAASVIKGSTNTCSRVNVYVCACQRHVWYSSRVTGSISDSRTCTHSPENSQPQVQQREFECLIFLLQKKEHFSLATTHTHTHAQTGHLYKCIENTPPHNLHPLTQTKTHTYIQLLPVRVLNWVVREAHKACWFLHPFSMSLRFCTNQWHQFAQTDVFRCREKVSRRWQKLPDLLSQIREGPGPSGTPESERRH